MLAVKLSVHQHVVDVNQFLRRVQQVFNDYLPCFASSDWPGIQHKCDGVADQLHCRPLVGILVSFLFGPNDLGFVARSITRERIVFGNIDSDDSRSEELVSLGYLV